MWKQLCPPGHARAKNRHGNHPPPVAGRGEEKERMRQYQRERKDCGGTRFLQKAGFPRTPSGENSYMASGKPRTDEDIVKSRCTKNSPSQDA
jgi:hypothetical protein